MQNPKLLKLFAETKLESPETNFSYVSIPVKYWSEVVSKIEPENFVSITKDSDKEISLIIATDTWEKLDKGSIKYLISSNWRKFTFSGEGLMEIVGYLSKISLLLAQNNISMMPFSTYHRFNLLVKESDYNKAQAILKIFLRQNMI
ncbi:MAG: ACT domain-containing protein [Cyanobacteriota bacterium]